MRAFLIGVLLSGVMGSGLADDSAEKFFAKVEAEALRKLERGKPEQKIEAAKTLDAEHAEQAAVALTPLLTHQDRAIRLGAAEALWELAGKDGHIEAAVPALRTALFDPDAAVAMSAAGALASSGVPETELAAARRRVLAGPVSARDLRFLAARGLIGIDTSAALLPELLAYYFDAVEAVKHGGADDNVELAEQAIESVVARNELDTIPVLEEALRVTPAATAFLLRQLDRFDPKPTDWVGLLLNFTDNGYRDTRATAFELLGKQTDAASLQRWLPKAVPLLADARTRDLGLDALSDSAGYSELGLPELSQLAVDPGAKHEQQLQALEILSEAADTGQRDGVASVKATAFKLWFERCDPIIASKPPSAPEFKACRGDSSWLIADDQARAKQWAKWLEANPEIDTKLLLLGQLESMWSRASAALPAVHAARQHPDARVVAAAEAALNRIEPAWRERGQRAAPVASAAASPAVAPADKPQTGRAADGAALYDAVRLGKLTEVKRLVQADNVRLPIRFGGIENPPLPIQVALNYCGIPQAEAALPSIVAYLIEIGANPDVPNQDGMSALDMAKYSCPDAIMQILAKAPAAR